MIACAQKPVLSRCLRRGEHGVPEVGQEREGNEGSVRLASALNTENGLRLLVDETLNMIPYRYG
jgi:hypothetical protein